MSEKIYEFNADELVQEMNYVMRKGIGKILKEFIDRYELLEKTHKQIMRLPSVLSELNLEAYTENVPSEPSKEIDQLNSKIDHLEKKMDKFISIFDNYLLQKVNSKEPQQIKSSIVETCENENIKMEIKEVDKEIKDEKESLIINSAETFLKVDEDDQEVDETDEEEEEEEEVEEEEEEEVEEDSEEILTPTFLKVNEEDDNKDIKEEEIETEASSDEEEEEEQEEEEEEEEDKVLAPPFLKVEEVEQNESVLAPPFIKVEEEEEYFEIEIDDITYYTNDEENGFLYAVSEDEDVGDKVGYIKDGEPFFYADEN